MSAHGLLVWLEASLSTFIAQALCAWERQMKVNKGDLVAKCMICVAKKTNACEMLVCVVVRIDIVETCAKLDA